MLPPGWRQNMTSNNLNHKIQGSSSSSISDRVRNALAIVASPSRVDPSIVPHQHSSSSSQAVPPLQSPVLQAVPNTNFLNSTQKLVRRGKKKKEDAKIPVTVPISVINPISNVTSSTTVVIKNRFKHTRPILATHNMIDKKMKSGLDQIQGNYDKTSAVGQSSRTDSASALAARYVTADRTPHPTMKGSLATSIVPVAVLPPSPMQILSGAPRHNGAQSSTSTSIPCPACKGCSETTSIGNNFYKCFTCDKTYMPVHRLNVNQPPAAFYGLQNASTSMSTSSTTTTAPSLSTKKRSAAGKTPSKPSKKKKTIETVDLVSSDEDEKECTPPSEVNTTANVACTTTSTNSQVSKPGIASRMNLPDGAVQAKTNTSTPPPSLPPPPPSTLPVAQPSPSPSPGPSITPPPPNGEYKFHCNKAMFGELYGCTLAPTRVADNRMYLSLECNIHRNDTTISEKYTLSVGQNDVQQVMVYFGRVPSFVAIETATRFAEVACRRIGRDVLVPGSDDHKKRYIILALVSAFKNDSEAAVEIKHLVSCISPWARVKMLNLEEAVSLISQASLDVNQKELCYGAQLKPAGPVETLLIYPSPPKSGGIPVTNEDLACLADGTYLNDIIIDFYLKYLYEDILTPAQRAKTYMFNSYFYKRLTQKSSKATPSQMHAAVKKWTRNVDIFDKDFIIIPVNEHCHWYLVVVCFPGQSLPNSEDLNEKDEEESEDETADFIKETSSTTTESNTSVIPNANDNMKCQNISAEQAQRQPAQIEPRNVDPPKLSNPANDSNSSSIKEDKNEKMSEVKAEMSSDNIKPVNNVPTTEGATEGTDPKPVEKEKVVVYKQAFDVDEFIRPCILIFDSLVGSGHSRVFTNLRHYLSEEWSSRKSNLPARAFLKTNMKGCYPKIPRQNNDCDCGVFLLQYVESFFRQPVHSFRIPVHLEDWFTLEYVSRKREEIKELISTLATEYRNSR